MKAVKQKIKLEELFHCYSPERLVRYSRCPEVLLAELRDIKTIIEFSQRQFTPMVTDLRKKSLEYDKVFKAYDKTSRQTLLIINDRKKLSNHNFSYSIHCLNPQSIVPQFQEKRHLTELKLKFLESQIVDQRHWEKWFSPQENILKISVQGVNFQIKVGIILGENQSTTLFWQVFDATCDDHHHPQLFYFLLQYVSWLRGVDKDCENKLINRFEIILQNISSVLVFLAMREQIASRGGQVQKQTMKLNYNKGIKFMWKFDLFQRVYAPQLVFLINDEQCFELQFFVGYYGKILLKSQSGNSLFINEKQIQIRDRDFLFQFSVKVYNYVQSIKKFQSQFEMLNSSLCLIMRIDGVLWRSEKAGEESEESEIVSDGVWGQIRDGSTVTFKLQQDQIISYPEFEKGFFGYLLKKLSIPDLVGHICLRQQIIKANKEFQFKLYQANFLAPHKQIIYEFRSYRYSDTHPRLFKNIDQKNHTHPSTQNPPTPQNLQVAQSPESNDNFIILLKIAPNFSWVSFLAYKASEGQLQKREITDNFLPLAWKQYRQKVGDRYEWRYVFQCISYICKCYLVERSYNRRMTQQQRKMTIYRFK